MCPLFLMFEEYPSRHSALSVCLCTCLFVYTTFALLPAVLRYRRLHCVFDWRPHSGILIARVSLIFIISDFLRVLLLLNIWDFLIPPDLRGHMTVRRLELRLGHSWLKYLLNHEKRIRRAPRWRCHFKIVYCFLTWPYNCMFLSVRDLLTLNLHMMLTQPLGLDWFLNQLVDQTLATQKKREFCPDLIASLFSQWRSTVTFHCLSIDMHVVAVVF